MKRIFKWLATLTAIGAIALGVFIYQYGKPRIERELVVFTDAIRSCAPLAQDYLLPGLRGKLARGVVGPQEDGCKISQDGLGGETMFCTLTPEQQVIYADETLAGLQDINIFGQVTGFRMSTSDPSPLTQIMNSEACTVER